MPVKNLADLAAVARMTAEQFKQARITDAAGALLFIPFSSPLLHGSGVLSWKKMRLLYT